MFVRAFQVGLLVLGWLAAPVSFAQDDDDWLGGLNEEEEGEAEEEPETEGDDVIDEDPDGWEILEEGEEPREEEELAPEDDLHDDAPVDPEDTGQEPDQQESEDLPSEETESPLPGSEPSTPGKPRGDSSDQKRASFELSGGWASGDVHRQYDVRVALDQDSFQEIGRYESDVVRAGSATHVNFALGFRLGQWWELSFQAGLLASEKSMTSGWEMYESANTSSDLVDWDIHDHGSVLAYQGVISPRARFFSPSLGPVKLFAMGGLKVVIMDGLHVPDLNVVNYPDKPSRTLFGASGGGGLVVDTQDYLGIFAEVDMVTWLGDSSRDVTSSGQDLQFRPGLPVQVGYLLRPTVGIQYRF